VVAAQHHRQAAAVIAKTLVQAALWQTVLLELKALFDSGGQAAGDDVVNAGQITGGAGKACLCSHNWILLFPHWIEDHCTIPAGRSGKVRPYYGMFLCGKDWDLFVFI
jgi:hypothetical protein